MPKYKTKPVVVTARRLERPVEVLGDRGLLSGKPGDWLVIQGKYDKRICTHEVFMSSYEPVDKEAKAEMYKEIR